MSKVVSSSSSLPARARVLSRLVVTTFVLLAPMIFVSKVSGQNVFYVATDGQIGNPGDCFASGHAIPLDYALTVVSQPGDFIVVKEGTYQVPITNGAPGSFRVSDGRQLYGGYDGSECAGAGVLPSPHGIYTNTILEGDLGLPLGKTQHVVSVPYTNGVGVGIDGFLIRDGYATNGHVGGGIIDVCTPLTLRHCTLINNQADGGGGGLYITGGCITSTGGGTDLIPYPDDGDDPLPPGVVISLNGPSAHVTILEDVFDTNSGSIPNGSTVGSGGGVLGTLIYGDVLITSFLQNHAPGGGGGMYITAMGQGKYLDFANCEFWDNKTSGVGGGLSFGEADATHASRSDIINCTFADNFINNSTSATSGQALASSSHCGPSTIYNSIFYWNNNLNPGPAPILVGGTLTVGWSDVQGGIGSASDAGNNIDIDPLFVTHRRGNLHLVYNPNTNPPLVSPCIDVANFSKLPPDTYDLNHDGCSSQYCKIPYDLSGMLPRWVDNPSAPNTGFDDSPPPYVHVLYLDMGAYEQQ